MISICIVNLKSEWSAKDFEVLYSSTLAPFSKLVGPWVCSDNQKVWIIKAHAFIYNNIEASSCTLIECTL